MITNLLDYFDKTVENSGDKIAVTHNDEGITFKALRQKAKIIAAELLSVSDRVNSPVAVFLPKEINTVISDLGIMYSSNPFMNLDIKTPEDRIENILNLIRPAAIITNEKFSEKLPETDIPIIKIDRIDFSKAIEATDFILDERRRSLIDTDPFCIINTSGSTGTPKGVILCHRSFFDFMAWADETFHFDGSEIMGSLSPVVFDIFDFELCMMMIHGTRLVLLDLFLAAFPARLLEVLNKNSVNFIFWVPSIMVTIANMDLLTRLPLNTLKLVWFAGEVFPTKQFNYWYDNLPDTTFANLYGPIEITLDCTFYVVKERPDETKPLPIGIPCHNTDILILNDEDKKCAVGEEGELCVRGTSLAMGYYNNPEKTSAAFTQNPLNHSYPELIYRTGDMAVLSEDGNIIFKGRKDSLVKHMGYRIELGEIEHEIQNDLKLVKYCCAVYQYAKKEIVLYYENDTELTDEDFRKSLSTVFPAYMIPNVYVKKKALPRNTNGKIDRLLLKEEANAE